MTVASRRAPFWRWVGGVLLAALVVSYVAYARTPPVHGGTPMGLLYGVVALALVLILAGFAIRKRAYKSTWGTLDGWLQAHLYLGVVSAAAVVFHAGFQFRDQVATAAGVTLFAVVLTGLLGAYLYTTLPRQLTRWGSHLSVEEISNELNRLAGSMSRQVAGRSTLFRRVADGLETKLRPSPLAGWRLLLRAGRDEIEPNVERLLARLDESEREPMRELLSLYRQHRELHRRLRFQKRYKNLLESWLYLHLPLTAALFVLIAAHVVAAFYFGAW